MRDPRAPIPSPACDAHYWSASSPPPLPGTRADAAAHDPAYDPRRLLRQREPDAGGIDRRTGPRRRGEVDSDPARRLLAAAHRRPPSERALLGLCTRQGWAIVRALSLAPQGVLLHHVDLLDPELDAPLRARGRALLSVLAPLFGAPRAPTDERPRPSSPLATVGTCILARRVVADLAAWSNPPRPAPTVASLRGAGPAHEGLRVGLLVPAPGAAPVRPVRSAFARVEGELASLSDPDPQVLAVALSAEAHARLHLAFFGHAGPGV